MSSLQVVRIKRPSCPLPLSSHRQLATGPHWVSPRFHLSANLCEWPPPPLRWDRPHTETAPSSPSSWERGESNQNHAGWAEIRLSIITKLSATSKGQGAGGKPFITTGSPAIISASPRCRAAGPQLRSWQRLRAGPRKSSVSSGTGPGIVGHILSTRQHLHQLVSVEPFSFLQNSSVYTGQSADLASEKDPGLSWGHTIRGSVHARQAHACEHTEAQTHTFGSQTSGTDITS